MELKEKPDLCDVYHKPKPEQFTTLTDEASSTNITKLIPVKQEEESSENPNLYNPCGQSLTSSEILTSTTTGNTEDQDCTETPNILTEISNNYSLYNLFLCRQYQREQSEFSAKLEREQPTTMRETDRIPNLCDGPSELVGKEQDKKNLSVSAHCRKVFIVEKDLNPQESDKLFSSNQHLNIMRTQKGKEIHQCKQCNKSLPVKCSQCNEAFALKSSCPGHLCDTCGKASAVLPKYVTEKNDTTDLRRHVRTHGVERRFKYNYCDKAFINSPNLVVHLRTHTGEKPFQCDQCDRAFTQKGHLTRHHRTHSGEKPFQCNKCHKAFTQLGNLTAHLRTHSGEKPFQCDQCNKAFARKRCLIEHLRGHSGEKPFQCDQCDKTFGQKGTLNRRLKTHSREKPYKCA